MSATEWTCIVEPCESSAYRRGKCLKHYRQWLNSRPADPTFEERFWSKAEKSDDCWTWAAYRTKDGYGTVTRNGRSIGAHRVAYELARGPIPDGMEIDHICHTRACVRPDHLRVVTHAQNGQNRAGAQANSTTGHRGVFWHKARRKWQVAVNTGGRQHYGGIYADLNQAIEAAHELRDSLLTHHQKESA